MTENAASNSFFAKLTLQHSVHKLTSIILKNRQRKVVHMLTVNHDVIAVD